MKNISAALLALLASGAMAQVTCTTIGTFTTCSDGSSTQRIGSTTIHQPAPPPPQQRCFYDSYGRYVCH